MAVHEQEREAKLLPVVSAIFVCAAVILIASYFIGNAMF